MSKKCSPRSRSSRSEPVETPPPPSSHAPFCTACTPALFRWRALARRAVAILNTPEAEEKAQRSREAACWWRRTGRNLPATAGGKPDGPAVPARPARSRRPVLLAPRHMPKRRIGGESGRRALLHALAHIELTAIDLAWDMIARFGAEAARDLAPDGAFLDDWVAVAEDEARHFLLLQERLASYQCRYGDLPAHDGLWQAADDTRHDLLARLAVVPMVLEARGLDVTPAMIERLAAAGDEASAAVLRTIHEDEISHVRAGVRWFEAACHKRGVAPAATFRRVLRRTFKGDLKPPFNHASRAAAGLSPAYYEA